MMGKHKHHRWWGVCVVLVHPSSQHRVVVVGFHIPLAARPVQHGDGACPHGVPLLAFECFPGARG